MAALLVGIAWLPLLALAASEGSLLRTGAAVPLLGDYAMLSKLLVAMPLLILAAPQSDALLRSAIRQLVQSDLVRDARRPSLEAILARIRQLRDSSVPELLCLALAFVPLLAGLSLPGVMPGLHDWHTAPSGALSAAGQWYYWVSVPIFRFVGLIWLWRFLLWCYLLWRLSRIDLDLQPAHADGAGGIGYLGWAQQRFAIMALAGGFVLCGYCFNHVMYLNETVYGMKHLLAGYVIGSTLLLVAPLLLMSPRMMKEKRHVLMKYNTLGNRTVRLFDRRWRRGQRSEDATTLLDKGDASALADFNSVYAVIVSMSVVPVTRWNMLGIALYAAAPLIPLIFLAMSLDELVQKLVGILV